MTAIEIKAEIQVPKAPNFLVMKDGQKIPLSLVPDADLKKIGEQYGEALVAKKKELGAGRMKKREAANK